jgi:hypothetical protein
VKEAFEIFALHDGEATGDATTVDFSKYAKLKTGNIAGLTVEIVLNGTGAAQTMDLQVTSTSSVNVKAVRQVV